MVVFSTFDGQNKLSIELHWGQAITTDNGFILKRKLKEIREKRKSHKPFQSYLLTGQADSAKKAG